MKKLLLLTLFVAGSSPVFSQLDNVALLFHTSDDPKFAFLDRQADMIKDDLLFIYGFRTSPYKNYSKLNFINSIANECQVDTSQLIIYVAGITLKDESGSPFIMLADSDSTDFGSMLSYAELFDAVEGCEVHNLLVIMDVTNSGEFMKSNSKELKLMEPFEPDSTTTNEDFIAKKMPFKTRAFIANTANELEMTGRYTTFSSKLMEALRNYGGNDGILNMYEIQSYMENLVNPPVIGAFQEHQEGGDLWMISR